MVAIATAVTVLAAAIGLQELARSRTVQLFGRIVPRVAISERVVALTFDDGPTPGVLNEIIDVLAQHPRPGDLLCDRRRAGRLPGGGPTARGGGP